MHRKVIVKFIKCYQSICEGFSKRNYFLSTKFERDSFYQYWINKADNLQISHSILGDVLELSKNNIVHRIYNTWIDIDSYPTGKIAGKKALCSELLSANGIPVPKHVLIKSQLTADIQKKISNMESNKVVIKPASYTSSGRGITIGIDPSNKRLLNFAILKSFIYSNEVLVEEFVEGDNYRFLVFKDHIISVVNRLPPHLIGDGISSVSLLLEQENHSRITKLKRFPNIVHPMLLPIIIDKSTLKKQGVSKNTIVQRGQAIKCREESNYSVGGTTIDVTRHIHPDISKIAIKAANTIGINLAGVDIICDDITAPIGKSNVRVNEINTTPGLRLHYEVINQEEAKDPCGIILQKLFQV